MVLSAYDKILDPVTGIEFYLNNVTGESSWEKPLMLRSTDIPLSKDPRYQRPELIKLLAPSYGDL